MTREEALATFTQKSEELANTHREWAMVARQALEARVQGYWSPEAGDSVSARDRYAQGVSMTFDVEETTLRGEIRALEVELAHARFVLENALG